MSNKYPVLLKGLLVILALTIWVDSSFPVGEGNARNSPANEPIIPEYSYGLGYVPLEGKVESSPLISSTYTAPSLWDWRNATYNSVTGNWTSSAKNQGGCGSCWDFAAHGALEAIINVRSNNPNLDLDLSEQYILSCHTGGFGCDGWNAYWAYEYMYNHGGTIPETCLPYYADDDKPCSDKCASWQDLLVPISDYGYNWYPGRDAIKNMIYEHGPVCLSFAVYEDFYTGSPSFDDDGVYQYDGVSEYRGGHQIVAIGYEDTPDNPDYDGYWICKNSWGATWGPWSDGCFGIAYGECDIEEDIVWVDYVSAAPKANFEAEPTFGLVPLSVPFMDSSAGLIDSWFWDFGDGQYDTVQNPSHTYSETGLFDVSLIVSGGGKADTTVKHNFIQGSADSMVITDVYTSIGGKAVVPVWGVINGWYDGVEWQDLDGVVCCLTYDTIIFSADTVTYALGDHIPDPDFWGPMILPDSGVITIVVVFDYEGVNDLSAPGRYHLFDLIFSVVSEDTGETIIDLKDGLGIPAKDNDFVYKYKDVYPYLVSGTVTILDKPLFIRADVDASGGYTLGDGLFFLNYFFTGSPFPGCMETADIDDSGDLTLGDGLYFLNYFFTGSPGIPPPSPDCGPDPTPDDLGCMSFPPCMAKGEITPNEPLVSARGAEDKVIVRDAVVEDGEVVVAVELVNVEDITGVDITLGYDASVLKAEKVEGEADYDYFVGYTEDAGKVRIGVVPDLELKDAIEAGERVIAEVVFKVKVRLDDGVKVSVERADLYGRGVKQVKSEWIGGLVKAEAGLPKEFALSQNYPNPFNPTTLIRYALPVDCQVRLDVYNVVGQRVATLVGGQQKAGYNVATWDSKGSDGELVSSGVYFYRLQAGDFKSVRKLVVLR